MEIRFSPCTTGTEDSELVEEEFGPYSVEGFWHIQGNSAG
jgi:hypothetical protein